MLYDIDSCDSIIKEIGPGERIALSKLAVEHLETTGRPFRVAIDISIWQFQVQTGRGGTNPALRTLYYRLLRLLSLSIQPLFVFDGPNRPLVKRGRQTGGGNVSSMPNYMAKNLLDLFGFPYVSAPGEAEAECALLQQEGIVDAVLSDDVDTLMFGSSLTLRNWSSEVSRGNKNPTHVNAYHSKATKDAAGLDRAGIILVALMSGGDYAPDGIPSCGPKIACEAARAGFGEDLCGISRKDRASLNQWRERLVHELHTNESGFFRRKHKNLTIPENFPDKTILGYYTHPVVSSVAKLADLKNTIIWDARVKIPELRAFTAEAFEWLGLPGAKKFIRGVAPTLLIQKLWRRSISNEVDSDDMKLRAEQESRLVNSLHGRRSHVVTDGVPEVRVSFLPSEIVGLDLSQEDTEAYLGIELDDDSASDLPETVEGDGDSPTSPSKRKSSQFDPDKEQKIWIMETFAKLGAPLIVETWEEDMRNPKKFAARKAPKSKSTAKRGRKVTQTAGLDMFLKASKPGIASSEIESHSPAAKEFARPVLAQIHNERCPTPEELSDGFYEVMDEWENMSRKLTGREPLPKRKQGRFKAATKSSKAATSRKPFTISSDPPLSNDTNPWTLSQSNSDPPRADSAAKVVPLVKGKCVAGRNAEASTEKARWDAENMEIVSLLTSPEPARLAARGLIPHDFRPNLDLKRASYYEKILKGSRIDEIRAADNSRPSQRETNFSTQLRISESDILDVTLPSSQELPPTSGSPAPRGLLYFYDETRKMGRAARFLPSKTNTNFKQAVALRESLEGTWRAADEPGSMAKDSKRTFHGIEIVDLCDD